MANITSVHVTSGIPDGGTGTVSTIDELILVGLPLTGGTTSISGTAFVSGGTVTAVVSGTAFISGGTVTSVVSGTTVISSGSVTASINQGGSALSSTNGLFGNVLFNNAMVSASVGLPVNIISSVPVSGTVTSVVSGTTFVSGGT